MYKDGFFAGDTFGRLWRIIRNYRPNNSKTGQPETHADVYPLFEKLDAELDIRIKEKLKEALKNYPK